MFFVSFDAWLSNAAVLVTPPCLCHSVCTSSKNLCYEIIAELIYSVYSHPQFSIYSFCFYKRTQIASLWDRASVALCSPNPLLQTSRPSHTHSLLSFCCHASAELGPGQTGCGRSRLVPASVTPLYAPQPAPRPSLLYSVSLISYTSLPSPVFTPSRQISTHLLFLAITSILRCTGGKESNHGCIMLYKSADNAGCTK